RAVLKSFTAVTVDVNFETDKSEKSGRYTGVLLWSLIEKAGLTDVATKNGSLRHTVLITGRVGYAVALAICELDPNYEWIDSEPHDVLGGIMSNIAESKPSRVAARETH